MATTVGEIFNSAIQLEGHGQTVYERWQVLFAGHPKVSEFWREYAEDEKHHARLLQKIQSQLKLVQLNEPADLQVVEAARNAQAFLDHFRVEVDTLEEALELADEIEHSEINSVLEFLVTHFSSEASAKEMVHLQMRDHVEKLNTRSPVQVLGKTALTIKAAR